jgi:hypothetical protein
VIVASDLAGAAFFAGGAAGSRINHQAMRLLLRALGLNYDDHGFRTSFKSWALEHLKHPLDIPAVELALDHALGTKVGEVSRYQPDRPSRRPERTVERGVAYVWVLRGAADVAGGR